MKNYQFLGIGTDAEAFLRDEKTNRSVPVIGLLGGTKQDPRPVPSLGKGFAVQEDNVMAEFNVPVAKTAEQFSNNIGKMLGYLEAYFKEKHLLLDIMPTSKFTNKQLAHPQAQHIGCEPDLCVWTRQANTVNREHPFIKQHRSAAAHVHISFSVDGQKPSILDMEPIVKGCDALIGVSARLIDESLDRRKLYGKAGAFRPKEYGENLGGVEWRTLSNFWIKDPELVKWVFDGVQKVFAYVNKSKQCWWDNEGYTDRVIDAINKHDRRHVYDFCKMIGMHNPPAAYYHP